MLRNITRLAWCGLLAGTVCLVAGCPFGTPSLTVSPTAVSFDEDVAQANVTLSNGSGTPLAWQVDSKPEWLTVEPPSGTLSAQSQIISLQMSYAGVEPGNYSSQVIIGSTGGQRSIAVTAVVTMPPVLTVAPADAPLDFGTTETTRTFTVSNTGAGQLPWELQDPLPNGFTATPSSGNLGAGQSVTVTLSLDRANLDDGFEGATFLVMAGGYSHTLTVLANVQLFAVSPVSLNFGPLAMELPIVLSNNGTEAVGWTINPTLPSWLSLSPPDLAGTLGGGERLTIRVRVDRSEMGPAGGDGQIAITSDVSSSTVFVTVQGEDPILAVDPSSLDFGSSTTLETVRIQNSGTGTLEWSIEEGVLTEQETWIAGDIAWLAIDGSMNGETLPNEGLFVNVVVDRLRAAPNPDTPYEGYLRFYSADGDEQFVSVSQLTLPPTLRATPVNISFGTTYIRKQVAIWNAGLGTVNWRIDANVDSATGGERPSWITLSPLDEDGIASGAVTGEETSAVALAVDRSTIPPADQDYTWSFDITAVDEAGSALESVTITTSANKARVPTIMVDTGVGPEGGLNVDEEGVAFIPLGTIENTGTFTISNQGTGALFWEVDTTDFPNWLRSLDPSQGTLDPMVGEPVTVTVDREDLPYGGESHVLHIISNDPEHGDVEVRIELQVPKRVIIGTSTGSIDMGPYGISSEFAVANMGDPGSFLNFQVTSNKSWLYFYPEIGASEGTASPIKDWRTIDVSVNRAMLDGTGATGEFTITAFEIDEHGVRVMLDDNDGDDNDGDLVKSGTVTVSVEAAPLSFEAAQARTRVPSLVRFVLLMRDIGYRALALPPERLDEFVDSFTIFEKDAPIEETESSKFLTSGEHLKTEVAILLDYSGSMHLAAGSVADPAVANSPDPLQATYERCVGELIDELPASYSVALMEFHDRSQATRLVTAPDYGASFTSDKSILHARLENIAVVDHGATELLPAVEEATLLLAPDFTMDWYRIPFDDGDVRALICITDGRLTTPPGKTKDTLKFMFDRRVRFYPVGWGSTVTYEPLARISSGSGGHCYATPLENTGEIDASGNPIKIPVVEELLDWCMTDDAGTDPCDQSIAKDLQSQVVLSYVTLNEEASMKVRVEAAFDDPNDDEEVCIPDQHMISGSLTQKDHDFFSIAGDVRLGQISLRTDGIVDGRAAVIVRTEYMPRNISELEIRVTSGQPFTTPAIVPNLDGGVIEGWSVTEQGGGAYLLSAPDPGDVLTYGAFGDMLVVDFPAVALAPGEDSFLFGFEVLSPVWDAADTQGKYFCYPNSMPVNAQGFFAPAFPSPSIENFRDVGTGVWTFDIVNIGGSHVETGVMLHWFLAGLPSFVVGFEPYQGSGMISATSDFDTVTIYGDTWLPAGDYAGTVDIWFDTQTAGTPFVFGRVDIEMTVSGPRLSVSSDDFIEEAGDPAHILDFGIDTPYLYVTLANVGESVLAWVVPYTEFPDWLNFGPAGGNLGPSLTTQALVSVDRYERESGSYSHRFDVTSDGGTETIEVRMTVP